GTRGCDFSPALGMCDHTLPLLWRPDGGRYPASNHRSSVSSLRPCSAPDQDGRHDSACSRQARDGPTLGSLCFCCWHASFPFSASRSSCETAHLSGSGRGLARRSI